MCSAQVFHLKDVYLKDVYAIGRDPMILEKSFISDLREGKSAAYRQLIIQYQDHVVNTCFGFVHHREEAEDLAQEVFMEVITAIRRFRGEAKLSTWIYRIAVNKSLDHLRKQQRKKRKGFNQAQDIDTLRNQIQSLSASPDPHQRLEQSERQAILFHAISQLARNQRIAFTLHKVEGLSYQEVGEIMGVSLSAVESLIHRAKKNLKKRLFVYYQKKMV